METEQHRGKDIWEEKKVIERKRGKKERRQSKIEYGRRKKNRKKWKNRKRDEEILKS